MELQIQESLAQPACASLSPVLRESPVLSLCGLVTDLPAQGVHSFPLVHSCGPGRSICSSYPWALLQLCMRVLSAVRNLGTLPSPWLQLSTACLSYFRGGTGLIPSAGPFACSPDSKSTLSWGIVLTCTSSVHCFHCLGVLGIQF